MKKKILITIFILTLAFIWIHSMMPRAVSLRESSMITEVIRPILRTFNTPEAMMDQVARKAAHFLEFTAVGIELSFLLKGRKDWFLRTVLYGLSIAVIDESIQVFSNRGAQITDVWLDTSAVVISSLIILLIRHFKKRRGM